MQTELSYTPSLGLALSGSGNRTTFYIGFFEALAEAEIKVDYISAMSGGSLVAAAYACGTLEEFKKEVLSLNKNRLKDYMSRENSRGGLFSLDKLAARMQEYTKGMSFEDITPRMSFVTVDIETGEKIDLCMGDIAQAATVSCTLPGIFSPRKWGNRTLVDGGLLSLIPIAELKLFPVDVSIPVNMRGTKHIFSNRQLNAKKIINFFKKFLFIDEVETFFSTMVSSNDDDIESYSKTPGLFTVLGKSLDLALEASAHEQEIPSCDLLITPNIDDMKGMNFNEESLHYFYNEGRRVAEESIPQIRMLIKQKTKIAIP